MIIGRFDSVACDPPEAGVLLVEALVYAVLTVPLFLLFAWIARRLLGLRRLLPVRTFFAAVAGWLVGDGVFAVLTRQGYEGDIVALTAIVLGVLTSMFALVAFEAIARPRRDRASASSKNPIAAVRQSFDNVRRSYEIARIASRHSLGTGFGLARRDTMAPADAAAFGVSLREAFQEAGPVFVKLGQLLATRPDLIPPETADELGLLHQDVESLPRSDIEPVLAASLGRPIDSVFAEFDWEPLGSASIGQVYRARLGSGEAVVVKVRRPDVVAVVTRDLRMALDVAAMLEERVPEARKLGVASVADKFAAQLRGELDYRVEAANTIEAGASMATDVIAVPRVFEELSNDSVLVLGLIEGEPLGRGVSVGPDRGRRLADDLFQSEIGAMLGGHRFHADPHPGNVLVTPDGRLGLIDFGSAGRLDALERAAVTDILAALALNEPTMLRAATLRVGMGAGDVDPGALDRAFARLVADHLGPGAEPTAELFEDFLSIVNRFELRMPPSITEMVRALSTMQASLEALSPGYPIIDAAQAIGEDEFDRALQPENLQDQLRREAVRLAPVLRRAPYHLDWIAGQIEQGNLSVRVSLFSHDDDVRALSRLTNRAVLAFLGAALALLAVLLFQTQGGAEVSANVSLFDVIGLIALFFGGVLILRVVIDVFGDP